MLQPLGESPSFRAIQQHRSHVGVEESQLGAELEVCAPPDGSQGGKSEPCLGDPGFDVLVSAS